MSDFKKKYLKYKNKYLKTKIMMYGGSRNFRNVDDIFIHKLDNGNFICDVKFIDVDRGIKHVAEIHFSRDDPEGSFSVLDDTYIDDTYFFTKLELLQMQEQARNIAFPQIWHLFDRNELKKFNERRKPEIDKELANELRKEKEEEEKKTRMEQYERERPERERRKKLEEERIKKLEEERIRKLEEEERERKLKEKKAEENRMKLRKIWESLEEKISRNNIDSAIEEYMKIEKSLNEDEKKIIKKVFYYVLDSLIFKKQENITKIKLLLDLNLIESQKIITRYFRENLIPHDILELILSKSNENLEYDFRYQFYLIKKDRKYSDQQKEELSNNLKILLNKYNIDYD